MLVSPDLSCGVSIRGNSWRDLSSYFLTRGQSLEQLKDSFIALRVPRVRANLRQRFKHKAP